jgi:primosomal protein N' (replication factor Y)
LGRTGRGGKPGEVIISGGSADHAIVCAANHDFDSFYKAEMEKRRQTGFPPFSRLIGILFESTSQTRLEKAMMDFINVTPTMPGGVTALGPVPALVYKIRNRWRWKMLLKGVNIRQLHSAALLVEKAVGTGVDVSIDVDTAGFY